MAKSPVYQREIHTDILQQGSLVCCGRWYCVLRKSDMHICRLHSRSIFLQRRRRRDADNVAGKNEADGLFGQHCARDVFADRDAAGGTRLRGDEAFLAVHSVQGC